MRKIIVSLFLAFATTSSAQILNLGIKGGFNTPNLKIKNSGTVTVSDLSDHAGWHLGLVGRINLAIIYFQPELLYTTTTSKITYVTPSTSGKGDYVTQRLDIPLIGGFNAGPIKLFAGPVMSYHIESPMDILRNHYSNLTWGGQIGIGVKISNFLAELKFETPLSSVSQSATINGTTYNFDARNSMVILSFGYFFFN